MKVVVYFERCLIKRVNLKKKGSVDWLISYELLGFLKIKVDPFVLDEIGYLRTRINLFFLCFFLG